MEWKMPRGFSVRPMVFMSWGTSCPKNGMLPTWLKRYQISGRNINFYPFYGTFSGPDFQGKRNIFEA